MWSSTLEVLNVATNAGTAVVVPTDATGDPPFDGVAPVSAVVGLSFLVGAGLTAVDPDELLMFTMDTSSSEGGAEYPVGFVAITSM